MSLTAIPPMHELIEDYGYKTNRICADCRLKGRFNALWAVCISDDLRDTFMVCEFCDVAESTRQ